MNRRPPHLADTHVLKVRNYLGATPNARILRLDLNGTTFAFRAGQAVMLGRHGQRLRKPYSLACSPDDAAREGILEFLVGIDGSGRPGAHLDGIAHGSFVDLEGPFGNFSVPDLAQERQFLFVGGGTGIAPLRAMLHHVLGSRNDRAVSVVYSARTSSELVYEKELRALAHEGRIALTLTVTREAHDSSWHGERGRIGRRLLAPYLTDLDTLCFVCGPPEFVEHMAPLLNELGVAKRRIRKEDW
jgi:NAD(P)H-flavin reductase